MDEREPPQHPGNRHASRQPANTPSSAAEVAADDGVDNTVPASAGTGPTPYTPGPSRRRLSIAVGGGLLVIMIAVGAGFAPTVWKLWHEQDKPLVVPDRVDGLILAKDAAAEGTVDSLKGRLGAGTRLKLIKGAAYADAAGPARLVIFVGGVETSTSTEADLDKALQLLTAGEESGVTDLHQVSSGPSDAVVKCGSIQTDSGPMAVCGWADRDSLGIGFFPHRSVAEAAPLLGQMHAAMRRQR